MGILFSSETKSLDDLFTNGLQTTAYAERQIAEALPGMADKATDPQLRMAFEQGVTAARTQQDRIGRIFQMLGKETDETSCPAIDGILKAGDKMTSGIDDGNVLDAALTSAAQLAAHYGIAGYGTLVAWARELGRDDVATLLGETLTEKRTADDGLSHIAETRINAMANTGGTLQTA